MRFATAIALAVGYAGLTLAWGGVHPGEGAPWWVFAPFIMTFLAGVTSALVSARFPVPWGQGRSHGPAPRRVRLSWRSAFRLPSLVPMLVFVYYVYWALNLHFDLGWVVWVVAPLAAIAAALVARKCLHEVRLLREGETAAGMIDERSDIGEGPDRVTFHYTTAHGATVWGRGWDVGYGVRAGSSVPVFYDAHAPGEHVVACACWFEAE